LKIETDDPTRTDWRTECELPTTDDPWTDEQEETRILPVIERSCPSKREDLTERFEPTSADFPILIVWLRKKLELTESSAPTPRQPPIDKDEPIPPSPDTKNFPFEFMSPSAITEEWLQIPSVTLRKPPILPEFLEVIASPTFMSLSKDREEETITVSWTDNGPSICEQPFRDVAPFTTTAPEVDKDWDTWVIPNIETLPHTQISGPWIETHDPRRALSPTDIVPIEQTGTAAIEIRAPNADVSPTETPPLFLSSSGKPFIRMELEQTWLPETWHQSPTEKPFRNTTSSRPASVDCIVICFVNVTRPPQSAPPLMENAGDTASLGTKGPDMYRKRPILNVEDCSSDAKIRSEVSVAPTGERTNWKLSRTDNACPFIWTSPWKPELPETAAASFTEREPLSITKRLSRSNVSNGVSSPDPSGEKDNSPLWYAKEFGDVEIRHSFRDCDVKKRLAGEEADSIPIEPRKEMVPSLEITTQAAIRGICRQYAMNKINEAMA
jgi:hypothetical protein